MLRFACGWKKTCLVIVLEPAISASKQDIQFTFLSLLMTCQPPKHYETCKCVTLFDWISSSVNYLSGHEKNFRLQSSATLGM